MQTIKRMIAHQLWANKELLTSVRKSGVKNREALRLFRHIAVVEQIWITRLNGKSSAHLQIWSDDFIAEFAPVEELIADNERGYAAYMEALTEKGLDDILNYANQSGISCQTSIRDILMQVALHGQYHRGQINRILRETSGEPTALDYIIFSRLSE